MSYDGIPKIRANAAGIDLGSQEIFVSVDGTTVKVFPSFTDSLLELASYLKSNSIKTVAMESTGVLWIPLYDIIEAAGIEVYLVNGNHARNMSSPKSDSRDCRWLQQLHSCGLLRSSFVPKDSIRELRVYMREREDHVSSAAKCIQKIQKAFECMNIKFHIVISATNGISGLRVIEAIINGEEDPKKLLQLCDSRIQNKKGKDVLSSFKGNYKNEQRAILSQAYQTYNFYQGLIKECDKLVEELLNRLTQDLPEAPKSPSKPARHNQPQITDLHNQIVQLLDGRNVSAIPGFSDKMVLKLISELGLNLDLWPTAKHFTSYLGLCPIKKQSGKMNRTRRCSVQTPAGQIFRESAMSIASSKHLAMKGFYDRIKHKNGYKSAIKATARKLAILYYNFVKKGKDYVEWGLEDYDRKYKDKMFNNLVKKAHKFGMELVPISL